MAIHGLFCRKSDWFGGTRTTDNTEIDTTHVSEGVKFNDNESGAFSWGTALTNCWIHFRLYGTGDWSENSSADGEWFRLVDTRGGGVCLADIANGRLRLAMDSRSPLPTGTGVALPGEGAQVDIDINVRINPDGDGENYFDIYSDGVRIATASSDDTISGIVLFAGTHLDMIGGPVYSEVVVADESTIGWRVHMFDLDGDGGANEWDGDYQNIQEYRDGAAVATDTADERQVATLSAYGAAAGATVSRVIVQARAKAGATGPQNLDGVVRIAGTNYDAGDAKAPAVAAPTVFEFANDPSTSAAWNTTQFADLEAGVKSVT